MTSTIFVLNYSIVARVVTIIEAIIKANKINTLQTHQSRQYYWIGASFKCY